MIQRQRTVGGAACVPSVVTEELIEEEYRINNSHGAREAFERLAQYVMDRLDADLVGEALAELLPQIPTLLLWGAQDRSIPVAVGEAAHAALPGSEFALVPDAAHNPYSDNADVFNRMVVDFLSRHSPVRERSMGPPG